MVKAETRDSLLFVLITFVIPLLLVLAEVITGFGGILLIITAFVWMGFSLVIFGPLLG